MNDFYTENYQALLIEILKDKKIKRGIPCSLIGKINIGFQFSAN